VTFEWHVCALAQLAEERAIVRGGHAMRRIAIVRIAVLLCCRYARYTSAQDHASLSARAAGSATVSAENLGYALAARPLPDSPVPHALSVLHCLLTAAWLPLRSAFRSQDGLHLVAQMLGLGRSFGVGLAHPIPGAPLTPRRARESTLPGARESTLTRSEVRLSTEGLCAGRLGHGQYAHSGLRVRFRP
jgi:hypothetical protein